MLTEERRELISKLVALTDAGKIKWAKHDSPTSFIYKTTQNKFIADKYYTEIENFKADCMSLTILDSNNKVYDEIVICNPNIAWDNDYTLLASLYNLIYSKYNEDSGNQMKEIISHLPQ